VRGVEGETELRVEATMMGSPLGLWDEHRLPLAKGQAMLKPHRAIAERLAQREEGAASNARSARWRSGWSTSAVQRGAKLLSQGTGKARTWR